MNRLSELKIKVISLVKSPANKREFLLTKSNKEGIDIPVKLEKGGKLVMDIKLLEEKGLISGEERELLEKSIAGDGEELKEIVDGLKQKIEVMEKGKKDIDTSALTEQLKKLNEILVKKEEEKPGEKKEGEEGGEKEKTDEEKEAEKKEADKKKEEDIEKARVDKLVELIKTSNDPEVYKKAVKALRDGGGAEEKEIGKEDAEIIKSIKKLNDKIDSVILKSDQKEGSEKGKEKKKEQDENTELEKSFT